MGPLASPGEIQKSGLPPAPRPAARAAELHDDRVAERLQRTLEEALALFVVGDAQTDVIEHERPPPVEYLATLQ